MKDKFKIKTLYDFLILSRIRKNQQQQQHKYICLIKNITIFKKQQKLWTGFNFIYPLNRLSRMCLNFLKNVLHY